MKNQHIPWLMALSALIGMVGGMKIVHTPLFTVTEELSLLENSAIMEEVLKIVEYHYQREVDVDSLTQLGVECLLYQLDSFSHFYSQSHGDQRSLKELLNEDFGISVYWLDDELYYLHGAGESSFLPGSRIHSINNLEPESLRLDAELLEQAEITLYSEENKISSTFKLLDEKSSVLHFEIDEHLQYMRIRSFQKGTYRSFMKALELKGGSAQNLIIDLRGNPGGSLEEAIKLANQFYRAEGKEILRIWDRQGSRTIESTGKVFFSIGTAVILIDGYTASAAEAFVGMIRDQANVKVIGQKSRGKNVIMSTFPLESGPRLYLSTGQFDFPNEDTSDNHYILPDLELAGDAEVQENKVIMRLIKASKHCESEYQDRNRWTQCLQRQIDPMKQGFPEVLQFVAMNCIGAERIELMEKVDPFFREALEIAQNSKIKSE